MSFLKDSISFSASTILNQIITLFRGIILRIILIPEILGIYNLIQVIGGFLITLDLGISSAAARDLPILRGQKDIKNELISRSTVLWFSVFQSIIVIIFFLVYIKYFDTSYSSLTITIVSIILFCSSIITPYEIFLRSAQKYSSLSIIIILLGVVEFIFYLIPSYFFGINGLLFGVVFSLIIKVISITFISIKNKITTKFNFSIRKIKKFLKFGFPLKLVDYPMQYMVIMDLLWVTKFMDLKSLAIYTTANLFFKQSNQLSNTIGVVFETRIIKHYGKHESWEKISELIKSYIFFQLITIVPIIICLCSIAIPFIIRQFLPNYSDANEAIIYLLISNFFIVINSGMTIPWFIKKKILNRGISNLIGLIVIIISLSIFWFLFDKQSLASVAISVTLGYFFYFIYMLIAVGRELWSTKEIIKILFTTLFASIWTSIIIIYANSLMIGDLKFFDDLLRTLFIGLKSIICLSPIIGLGYYLSNFNKFIKKLD